MPFPSAYSSGDMASYSSALSGSPTTTRTKRAAFSFMAVTDRRFASSAPLQCGTSQRGRRLHEFTASFGASPIVFHREEALDLAAARESIGWSERRKAVTVCRADAD